MCGRFALTADKTSVEELFGGIILDEFPARYNIAPTQPILLVTAGEVPETRTNRSARKGLLARWGFLPGWVKDPRDFPLLINARAETAIEKASFRGAMRHRRVLIPASGFYEWHRQSKDGRAKGQAYWMRPRDGDIVAFAGLMETWASANGSELDTAAIVTTAAKGTIASIHERMPVVIQQKDFDRWLDCLNQEPRDIADLMRAPEDDLFDAVPVSDKVNKVANMGEDLQMAVIPDGALPARGREKPQDKQLNLF